MPELRRISARVTIRKGTATQWSIANPLLLDGELGWATDARMMKIGDGIRPWNELPYYETSGVGGGGLAQSLIHDGTIFPSTVVTGREAIEHTQRQVNDWNSCAEQDFFDGWDDINPSCVKSGLITSEPHQSH